MHRIQCLEHHAQNTKIFKKKIQRMAYNKSNTIVASNLEIIFFFKSFFKIKFVSRLIENPIYYISKNALLICCSMTKPFWAVTDDENKLHLFIFGEEKTNSWKGFFCPALF